jgi:hypothetical protein
MRLLYYAVLVGLIPAVSAIGERPDDELSRCSIRLVPGFRSGTETVVLATGARDTILAGPGPTGSSTHGGQTGTGAPGPIHGQVFVVARFAGANSELLSRAFHERDDRRVVIVPWAYDPSCLTSRWTSASAWTTIGEPGTFTLELRPEAQWADGMPVFDAFIAAFEPYPLSPVYRYDRFALQSQSSRWLSAEQYYELLEAMLTSEERQEEPDSAWHRFLRWQDDNAMLASLYPANQVNVDLARDISRINATRVLRSIRPVIAGTYRLSLTLDGAPERILYLRTRPDPTTEWHPAAPPPPQGPLEEPRQPPAYSVLTTGALTRESLAANCHETRNVSREGYMSVIDPPTTAGERRTEWRGWLEPNLLARQFPDDSALARFRLQAVDEWRQRRGRSQELEAPARYWLDRDSVLHLEQTTRLDDGTTLTVSGDRISSDVIACEW